jgi:FkbM family methyltransferase
MENISQKIEEIFFKDKSTGVMVEVGAAGPIYLSQSFSFKKKGWRCICIEPNPSFVKAHLEQNNEIYQYACSDQDQNDVDFEICHMNGEITNESFSSLVIEESFVKTSGFESKQVLNIEKIKVNVRKLNTILDEINVSSIDYLSIDAEGHEEKVLNGFSIQKYLPKVVLIENNYEDQRYDNYFILNNYNFFFKEGNNYIYKLK